MAATRFDGRRIAQNSCLLSHHRRRHLKANRVAVFSAVFLSASAYLLPAEPFQALFGRGETEILMACYEFTSRDIAEALENAAHRGVKVRIVADWKAAHDRFSQTRILVDAGIPVRLDHRYAIHHHKFVVIDGVAIETGSFNYTTAAIKHNAENALVLWNVPQIAKVYAREWERLWEESR